MSRSSRARAARRRGAPSRGRRLTAPSGDGGRQNGANATSSNAEELELQDAVDLGEHADTIEPYVTESAGIERDDHLVDGAAVDDVDADDRLGDGLDPDGGEPPVAPIDAVGEKTSKVGLIENPSWSLRTVLLGVGAAVVLTVVGGLVAYLLVARQSERYEGRAEVRYRLDNDLAAGFLKQDRRLSTQVVAIRSRAVLEPVAAQEGMDAEALRDEVTASVVDDSEVLRISVLADARETATRRAEEIRASYLPQANEPIDPSERLGLQASLDDTLQQEAIIAQQLVVVPGADTTTIRDLRADLERLRQLELDLRNRISTLEDLEFQRQPASALGKAYALSDPVSPKPALTAIGGALAGLLVAVFGLALVRLWSRRVGVRAGVRSA